MLGCISPENLAKTKLIIRHGSCPDGWGAQKALEIIFGKTIPVQYYYFEDLKTIPKNALFINCSPKDHQINACMENGCMIADHHDSFAPHFERLRETYDNVLLFGENRNAESGAYLGIWLASVYANTKGGLTSPLYPSGKAAVMARLLAISDTWQKQDPDFALARMYAGYVSFFGNDLDITLEELYDQKETVLAFGKAQERQQRNFMKGAIIYDKFISNFKIAMINGLNMSNAAEMLRTEMDVDLVCGYETKMDARAGESITIYSMRSKENGFDCSIFAKANNGGGHKAAAGFSHSYLLGKDPIETFLFLLEDWFDNNISEIL